MNPTTSQIYGQGQKMANQFNTTGQQYGQQYKADTGQAQQANSNLQSYTNNLSDPAQQYGNYLGQAQNMYGYNPQATGQAVNNLTAMQNQIANLPQAANQMSNYSGATAGQSANLYSNLLGNMQPGLTNANNSLTNMMGLLGATQNQANQQATLGLQGQQLKSSNLQNVYQNAAQQQSTAANQMQYFEGLYQQQGALSSQQAAQYAAASASYAAAQQAIAQAANTNETTKENQAQSSLMAKLMSTSNAQPSTGGGLSVGQAQPMTLSGVSRPSAGMQSAYGGIQ